MAMVIELQLPEGLPFQVGDEVELKSFLKGYRGAWFRCKITKTRTRKGSLQCAMEYCDFPDERIIWTSLYSLAPIQKNLAAPIPKGLKCPRTMELMLRPPLPHFHKHNETDNQPPSSSCEVTAIVNDLWRLGDLVDLWCDGCFWSGTIINLQSDGGVEVQLPGPPIGEGGIYKGVVADLRPSLNWSPEKGWSVPLSQANGDSWYTARLVQCSPLVAVLHDSDQSEAHVGHALDASCILCIEAGHKDLMSLNAASIMPLEWRESSFLARGYDCYSAATDTSNSNPSTVRPRNKCTNEKRRATVSSIKETCSERSMNFTDNVGSSDGASTGKSKSDLLWFGRKHSCQKSRRVVCLENEQGVNSVRNRESNGDAIETKMEVDIGESIMELEEVVNKIRWLKGLTRFGYSSWINRPSSTWKFILDADLPTTAHPNCGANSKVKQ